MNSVPARVEVENSTSSSSGFRIVCQGLKRLSGASPHENIHYRDDKNTVPSLVSDDIFRQLKELSRTELKDLCSEMSIFKMSYEKIKSGMLEDIVVQAKKQIQYKPQWN